MDCAGPEFNTGARAELGSSRLAEIKASGRSKGTGRFATLRVALVGLQPPVWRRVRVPFHIPLNVLHDKVLCSVLGFSRGIHMYLFESDSDLVPPEPGDTVTIRGLVNAPQYNGCTALVCKRESWRDGRITLKVRTESNTKGKKLAVRPSNVAARSKFVYGPTQSSTVRPEVQ